VYVAWWDERNNESIYFNRSLDSGTTWLATDLELDDDPSRWALYTPLNMTCDGDTVMVLWRAYHSTVSSNSVTYFQRSTDGGTNFSSYITSVSIDNRRDHMYAEAHILDSEEVFVGWLQEDLITEGAVYGRILEFDASP
jgi:hypothetical protein